MLSYDSPISVNGQSPASPTNLSNGTQAPIAPISQPAVNSTSSANGIHPVNGDRQPKYRHIWMVTGPAGCGKSTIAEYLAKSLNLPYIEGDSFHPPANIAKMANNIPLNDADRWDWLTALREESRSQLAAGSEGVVLTCSALKRKYRDVIRVAGYYDHSLLLHFIYLSASEEILLKRVGARENHYMGAGMVQSQINILEPPQVDETDVIQVDVTHPLEEVKRDALAKVMAAANSE